MNNAAATPTRILQVICAVLRDRHPEVDLGPVEDRAAQELQRLLTSLEGCRTADLGPAAFPRRMAHSMKKLVAASARLHDRSVATEADVALGVAILEAKVDFIRRLMTGVPDMSDIASRQAAIRRMFGGQEVEPKDIMAAFGIPRRTVMRDLEALGEKVRHGLYRIGAGGDCAGGTFDDGPEPEPPVVRDDAEHVRDWSDADVAALSAGQVQALTAAEVGAMNRTQFDALTPEQFSAFTPGQLASFEAEPFYRCLSLTQASSLGPEQAQALLRRLGQLDAYGAVRTLPGPLVSMLEAKASEHCPDTER